MNNSSLGTEKKIFFHIFSWKRRTWIWKLLHS